MQREAGQGLFDHFCADMDDNLREIGISDLKVPKEMQRMGEAFYGRAQAYQAALAVAGDEALIESLARNIYGVSPPGPAAAVRLAAYMREAVREVAAQDAAVVAQGALRLPDPAAIPAVAD
jgi:cytochrome b pre-mRNA-processing protein 3